MRNNEVWSDSRTLKKRWTMMAKLLYKILSVPKQVIEFNRLKVLTNILDSTSQTRSEIAHMVTALKKIKGQIQWNMLKPQNMVNCEKRWPNEDTRKSTWRQELKSLTRRDKMFPYLSLGLLSSPILTRLRLWSPFPCSWAFFCAFPPRLWGL